MFLKIYDLVATACRLDTNASQIGGSCKRWLMLHTWHQIGPLQSRTLWTAHSLFIKAMNLPVFGACSQYSKTRTRATDARTRMGGTRIQPLDLLLLSVALDVLAGVPVVQMCILNNSTCDEIGLLDGRRVQCAGAKPPRRIIRNKGIGSCTWGASIMVWVQVLIFVSQICSLSVLNHYLSVWPR